MAAPIVQFREILLSTPEASLNTEAKRLASITGQIIRSTGAGNEADFSTVDITAGAADSRVVNILWHVSDADGHTLASNFKFWASSLGFDDAATKVRMQPLSGADQGSPLDTENYVVNATPASYGSWTDMPETEPASQNVFPSDEDGQMAMVTTTDDAVMTALYIAVAAGETPGQYRGTDAGLELQFSFKYSYS